MLIESGSSRALPLEPLLVLIEPTCGHMRLGVNPSHVLTQPPPAASPPVADAVASNPVGLPPGGPTADASLSVLLSGSSARWSAPATVTWLLRHSPPPGRAERRSLRVRQAFSAGARALAPRESVEVAVLPLVARLAARVAPSTGCASEVVDVRDARRLVALRLSRAGDELPIAKRGALPERGRQAGVIRRIVVQLGKGAASSSNGDGRVRGVAGPAPRRYPGRSYSVVGLGGHLVTPGWRRKSP